MRGVPDFAGGVLVANPMSHDKQQISIWFFIGLLILIYGVLITGAGISDAISPPASPLVLSELHAGIWWGGLMIVTGGGYVYLFRPGRRG
jgi:hypothetical protein